MSSLKKLPWQNIFFVFFLLVFLGAIYLLNANFQYAGKMIVATPKMSSDIFQGHSVQVLEHTIKGSKGYMIDAPLEQMTFGEFAKKYQLKPKGKKASLSLVSNAYADSYVEAEAEAEAEDADKDEKKEATISKYDQILVTVYMGGPMSPEKIVVMHDGSVSSNNQKRYPRQDLIVTEDLDVIYALLEQKDIDKGGVFKIFSGYTSWGSGQLFDEVEQEQWSVHEIDHDAIWQEYPLTKEHGE